MFPGLEEAIIKERQAGLQYETGIENESKAF
jgi:hypothetical protein